MIGQMLYGYCGGKFGRSWNDRRIEAEGIDWIVARQLTSDAQPEFAEFSSPEEKEAFIKNNSTAPPEDDDDE